MMVFLDRVVNGNGWIEREVAIDSRRLAICLLYGDTQVAMERKLWRDGEKDPLTDGLATNWSAISMALAWQPTGW